MNFNMNAGQAAFLRNVLNQYDADSKVEQLANFSDAIAAKIAETCERLGEPIWINRRSGRQASSLYAINQALELPYLSDGQFYRLKKTAEKMGGFVRGDLPKRGNTPTMCLDLCLVEPVYSKAHKKLSRLAFFKFRTEHGLI